MQKQELRAAMSLAAVFSVRMLGHSMIYPVFAVFARQLAGATPYKGSTYLKVDSKIFDRARTQSVAHSILESV